VNRDGCFKERVLLFLVSHLGAMLILLLGRTWRLSWVGQETVEAARAKTGNGSVIYAFWHGRMLALCYSHRKQNIHIMVSEHRDGEMIAQTVQLLGFVPVRGSTTRGGLKALFRIAERATAGNDVAITPDGPKGPSCYVQPGVITLAQRTGMPIIPVANGASFKKNLSSWDRYLIPLPFSRVVIQLGSPIYVPKVISEEDLEQKRLQVEGAITALTQQADLFFGTST
jgi:lysophospholipid acyltransferase (LPLAT)-like uncharacterized protein